MIIKRFIYNSLLMLANKIYPLKRRMRDRYNEKVKRLKGKNTIDKFKGCIIFPSPEALQKFLEE